MAEQHVARLASVASQLSGAFTCDGKFLLSRPAQLAYKHQEAWAAVQLPASNPTALDGLVSASTPAGFGVGSQLVHDDQVRKALELAPSRFYAPFSLTAYNVLPQVQRLLKPDSTVTAELYKLNVYESGGFFNAHVDTPRGSMFGSLVVCLPSPHTGGQLIVTHAGNTVEYSWQDDSATHVQWAAFYSDCAHAVRPVTSGRRVTLTYNLYAREATAAAVDVDCSTLPVYRELQALLQDPAALPDGGTLGFGCCHLYACNSQLFSTADLKGADAALYKAATALRLGVTVNPAWVSSDDHDDNCLVVAANLETTLASHYVTEFDAEVEFGSTPLREVLEKVYGSTALREEGAITWVTQPSHQLLGLATSAWGNDPQIDTFYYMAAILVSIPPAAERQQLAGVALAPSSAADGSGNACQNQQQQQPAQ